jgi:hypothetical protein
MVSDSQAVTGASHPQIFGSHLEAEVATITVRFGNAERSDDGIRADWIQDQVKARRAADEPACAVVTITADSVDIRLATGDCPPGQPGGRPARGREVDILDRWRRLRLGEPGFAPHDLFGFVQQVRHLL